MNNYYFYVAPNEDELGCEFTISELIDMEFKSNPDNFPDKFTKFFDTT